VFEKLFKYIGKSIKALIDRTDEPHCLRLHKNRVFYVRESLMRRATNVRAALGFMQNLTPCCQNRSVVGCRLPTAVARAFCCDVEGVRTAFALWVPNNFCSGSRLGPRAARRIGCC